MTKVLFICHGNICRSPMAEYIFKELVKKKNLSNLFEISSAATSLEEIGNDIYPNAKRILTEHDIPFEKRAARQITKNDLEYYDYIVLMDQNNMRNLSRMFGENILSKVSLLMDYTNTPGDVSDPWYTRDFEKAYMDISEGCMGLLQKIQNGK